MADTILIWGAGAIGGTLGATWKRAGHEVLMADIDREHVRACRDEGLRIEGPVDQFQIQVPAAVPEDLSGTYRRIVLAVKSQATRSAAMSILPFLADDGFVLSAQNGLNEAIIADIVGAERTMGCFVNFSADWLEPGRILYGSRGSLVIGEIDGSVRDRTHQMLALARDFEPEAALTTNIWGQLWGKMTYAAMLGATAISNDSMAANFADPERFPVWLTLGREVTAVAQARGVDLIGFGEFDPKAFLPRAPEGQARAVVAWLAEWNSKSAKTHSGLWRDLAVRKRKTEIENTLAVSRFGREVGIATPAIDLLVSLVRDIEDGKRDLSFDTFKELLDRCK